VRAANNAAASRETGIALLQILGSLCRYGNEEVSQHVMQILLKLFAGMRSIVDFIKNKSDLL
jgi:hypothetical protein